MFSKFERMIAFRYLRARRKEGFVSVITAFSFIGIMLGVATLIVVMAVMNGFRSEITSKILGTNGHIRVLPLEQEGTFEHYADIQKQLMKVAHVTSALPVINKQVMATTDTNTVGAMVQGIDLASLKQKPIIFDHIIRGDIGDWSDDNSILLGSHLAYNLGVDVGDTVKLLSPSVNVTVLGSIPRIKTYQIAALFEVGMYEYDNSTIFMPLTAAQTFFKMPHAVSTIEVTATRADLAPNVAEEIRRLPDPLLYVQDWQMMNASLFNALKVEQTVMFFILTLIVCIAAFNIVSSLIMLVNDKRKDIAILRTMGATRPMVLRIFMMCGSTIGVVGTLAGLILGVLFASNIETIRRWLESLTGHELFNPVLYFLSELPAELKAGDVVLAVGMGISLSLLATIYPAFKAAKQDPVEVLRYE